MTAIERDPFASAHAPQTAGPLLSVRDLAITHEGEDAATPAAVSFDIAPGKVVLLLGPSGSGKSTLTLALNGLIPHAVPATVRGTILLGDLDTADTPVAELSTRVGMVFQDPDAQLVTGTLLDEVAFGPENLRMPVADVLARAESALRRVGLWERRGENPDRLSGGGKQRLAIACALALGSPLLVLDEPTANLDPRGTEEVYAALGELVASGERAILLVEHNLDAAIPYVDRVVVLDRSGRLVADGPIGAVLRERADELHELGVWLPASALAALRLRRAGYTLEPLPLTPGELRSALEVAPPVRVAELAAGSEATPSPQIADSIHTSVIPGVVDPRPDVRIRTDSAQHPLISVRGLSLRRGRTQVLHDIDLDVPRGQFTAIVGANGAGKTSLIQAIAGVVPPPRGSIHIDGVDVRRADARVRGSRIGFVFQNPEHQFVTNTVFDELAYGLRGQHLSDDEVRARVDTLLERFGLIDRAQTHPFLLSGGQKRRLSVGTALVAGAPVLALDEPTFGQDRARADELLGLLRELNQDGTTILIVTHDMQLVAEYADRMLVMAGGRVVGEGATSDVFANTDLIETAGLRVPPLARALRGLERHPELAGVARLRDLPGPRSPRNTP